MRHAPTESLLNRIIEILKQALIRATVDSKVDDQTKHVLAMLYMVGLGCAWAAYADQFIKVTEIIKSHCGRDRKLTELCEDILNRLIRNAKESAYPPRRMGMLLEPFLYRGYKVRDRLTEKLLNSFTAFGSS